MESKPSPWKDWNGKTTREYFVKIPLWLVRAYRVSRWRVKVVFHSPKKSVHQMIKEKRASGISQYFKKNWWKKINKMRILNKGYIRIDKVADLIKESPCGNCENPNTELIVKVVGNLAKIKCQDICPDYNEYLKLKKMMKIPVMEGENDET